MQNPVTGFPKQLFCRESASVAVEEPFSASVAAVVHLLQQQLHLFASQFHVYHTTVQSIVADPQTYEDITGSLPRVIQATRAKLSHMVASFHDCLGDKKRVPVTRP
jgi:hypothetical protein